MYFSLLFRSKCETKLIFICDDLISDERQKGSFKDSKRFDSDALLREIKIKPHFISKKHKNKYMYIYIHVWTCGERFNFLFGQICEFFSIHLGAVFSDDH